MNLIVVKLLQRPTMIGHTRRSGCRIAALRAVDTGLGRVASSARGFGGAMIVTADHGNCETMI